LLDYDDLMSMSDRLTVE